MSLILPILISLSLNAIVDANKITFAKVNGRIYIETDEQHYAMFGQVTDNDGVRVVVVNGDTQYQQNSKCLAERTELKEVDPEHLKSYAEIRVNYLRDSRKKINIFGNGTGNRRWSANISTDKSHYLASMIDHNIVAYASPYFPSKLARVIMDADVVMFVHKNGYIAMKTINCLLPNEKILVKGIKKINTGDHLIPRMAPVGDGTLDKYLRKHPIDESKFYTEQEYIEPAKKSWMKRLLPSRFDQSTFSSEKNTM